MSYCMLAGDVALSYCMGVEDICDRSQSVLLTRHVTCWAENTNKTKQIRDSIFSHFRSGAKMYFSAA